MNDDVSLTEVLLLKNDRNELMLRLSHVAKSEFCSGLYLPIWYSIINTVLLSVERLFSFLLLLLVLVLRVETVKEHEVNLHYHFLLLGARLAIKLDTVVTDIIELYFLFTELDEEGFGVEG